MKLGVNFGSATESFASFEFYLDGLPDSTTDQDCRDIGELLLTSTFVQNLLVGVTTPIVVGLSISDLSREVSLTA